MHRTCLCQHGWIPLMFKNIIQCWTVVKTGNLIKPSKMDLRIMPLNGHRGTFFFAVIWNVKVLAECMCLEFQRLVVISFFISIHFNEGLSQLEVESCIWRWLQATVGTLAVNILVKKYNNGRCIATSSPCERIHSDHRESSFCHIIAVFLQSPWVNLPVIYLLNFPHFVTTPVHRLCKIVQQGLGLKSSNNHNLANRTMAWWTAQKIW